MHDQQLWTMHEKGAGLKHYTHELNEFDAKICFDDFGITVICNFDLSEGDQIKLANCLVNERIPFVPHWQSLTIDVHRTVQMIEAKILEVARLADHGFRRTSKGIRLPPRKVQLMHINQSQAYPVMNWHLSDEEKDRLSVVFEKFPAEVRSRYEKGGIMIPFSVSFGQKQIHLNDHEVEEAFNNMDAEYTFPPFWALYAISWQTFAESKSHDAAILVLATSIETALKWCLKEAGDAISNFLIEHTQSPPLRRLYECACENTSFDFPDHFAGWLGQLSTARNFVAHKPRGFEIDFLQMGRWFAVGEAIMKAIAGKANDPLVGYLVKPNGDRAIEHFTDDACGVVLRSEEFRNTGEARLHVLMDTGETYYFSEESFEKLTDKRQKFPDIN